MEMRCTARALSSTKRIPPTQTRERNLKLYIDSADTKTWALPAGCPPVVGVTTNPSLVFQAGLPVTLATYLKLINLVAQAGFSELMVQLPTRNTNDALQWLTALQAEAATAQVQLTIKLPCAPDWQDCIAAVRSAGQAILLTGLSNPVQLLWAQSQGANYVAPYVGRLAADGRDVWALMEACVKVQESGGPQLLAASIKSADVLARLIGVGAAAVTLPPASLSAWTQDTLTQTAISQFDRDIAASLQL
jgi:transaldolase